MAVDYMKKEKADFTAVPARQNIRFRWLVYYGLIFAVLLLGVYGSEYNVLTFIYFRF